MTDFKWVDNGDEIVLAALYFDPKCSEPDFSPHIKQRTSSIALFEYKMTDVLNPLVH